MKPGTKVGAHRWPGYAPIQPWLWGKPWQGTLLAVDDPRAWKDSMATGLGLPTKKLTRKHVAWCHEHGMLKTTVPVLWHFENGDVVHWENVESVVVYEQDLDRWTRELELSWEDHEARVVRKAAA